MGFLPMNSARFSLKVAAIDSVCAAASSKPSALAERTEQKQNV
jgi:hypothetical protein